MRNNNNFSGTMVPDGRGRGKKASNRLSADDKLDIQELLTNNFEWATREEDIPKIR